MIRKRIALLVAISSLLASCDGGGIENGPDSPMVVAFTYGDIVFNIQNNSTKEAIGTMKFLPLEESKISISFSFNSSFNKAFVFTYSSDIFSVARRSETGEVAESKFLYNYPYVEKSSSLHGKLSKIVFEGATKSVTEGSADIQRIALNGSGVLTFEYNAVFDPSKNFYVCEGISYMPSGFSLLGEKGKKVGEGCD